jgi:pimeloyl-ACP methyl ester carboxylesterase
VVIVLSGGPFDAMNPPEVLDHMERLISDLNADPWVQERTAGGGLRYKLLPEQVNRHLHQAQWRVLRDKLKTLTARPLIIVGHSNGGAAAVDLARMLADDDRIVDLLITADSVATVDDVGDINEIPSNVRFNLNSYVIPTPAWLLAPFPIGRRNKRQAEAQATALVNVGLAYDLPGAVAHRNAFYDLAGGDFRNGSFAYPDLMLDAMLATLRGTPDDAIVAAVATELQVLADRARVVIELESRQLTRTIRPQSKDVVERVQASSTRSADAAAFTVKRPKAAAPQPARSRKRKTRPSKRRKTT